MQVSVTREAFGGFAQGGFQPLYVPQREIDPHQHRKRQHIRRLQTICGVQRLAGGEKIASRGLGHPKTVEHRGAVRRDATGLAIIPDGLGVAVLLHFALRRPVQLLQAGHALFRCQRAGRTIGGNTRSVKHNHRESQTLSAHYTEVAYTS